MQLFISYTGADAGWAEWIAWQLEAAGHQAIVQAWDFRPGDNFVAMMRRALDTADRTIAVVSAAYLESVYGSDEWTAAFIHDQRETTRLLVVRVEDVPLRAPSIPRPAPPQRGGVDRRLRPFRPCDRWLVDWRVTPHGLRRDSPNAMSLRSTQQAMAAAR